MHRIVLTAEHQGRTPNAMKIGKHVERVALHPESVRQVRSDFSKPQNAFSASQTRTVRIGAEANPGPAARDRSGQARGPLQEYLAPLRTEFGRYSPGVAI
jgi:hypothetical protein